MQDISYFILSALAVLIILTVHEYCHGYVAYKLGDNTAKSLGRLTLNPIKHLDPIGALCMVFLHFGWAKPVPVNGRNFKNPRRDFALVALAGPLSNIILAIIFSFIYVIFEVLYDDAYFSSDFLFNLVGNTAYFLYIFHYMNLGIAIFNLIPIPPLDGSRIISAILPYKIYYALMKHERKIYFGLLIWLLVGPYAYRFLLSIPLVSSTPILKTLARYVSLSNILSHHIQTISDVLLDFSRKILIF